MVVDGAVPLLNPSWRSVGGREDAMRWGLFRCNGELLYSIQVKRFPAFSSNFLLSCLLSKSLHLTFFNSSDSSTTLNIFSNPQQLLTATTST